MKIDINWLTDVSIAEIIYGCRNDDNNSFKYTALNVISGKLNIQYSIQEIFYSQPFFCFCKYRWSRNFKQLLSTIELWTESLNFQILVELLVNFEIYQKFEHKHHSINSLMKLPFYEIHLSNLN